MNRRFFRALVKRTRLSQGTLLRIGVLASLVVAGLACKHNAGNPYADIPPITRLSNLPPTQDTITSSNPRLTLYWIGDDPDGYVVAFKYRWSFPLNGIMYERPWSTILNIGVVKNGAENFALMLDTANYTRTGGPGAYNGQRSEIYVNAVYHYFATLPPEGLDSATSNALGRGDTILIAGVRVFASNPDNQPFPVHVNPNSGTFIFDSQDSLNFHTFEISAVDNQGVVGPPAKISFNTLRVTMPRTQISGVPADSSLVLDSTTATFGGLTFTFSGIDPNSRTLQFAWNIDSLRDASGALIWSPWSENTTANITANDFDPAKKLAVDHVFSVRSRNEFGAIDTAGFYANIQISGNNPQSNTGAVIVNLDKDGGTKPIAGTYNLVADAGTNPGTMKFTYNNGIPVDNVAPLSNNIVLHGGAGGKLTISTQLRPATLPQQDPVAVIVASVQFHAIYPQFARTPNYRRYLVLHNSYHWNPGTATHPSYQMIEKFYSDMFDTVTLLRHQAPVAYDFWDVHPPSSDTDKTSFPSVGQLGNYSLVFLIADTDSGGVYGFPPYKFQVDKGRVTLIKNYLFVGGKLVISSQNILHPINSDASLQTLIHLDDGLPCGGGGIIPEVNADFGGATADPAKGYPDVVLDTTKLGSACGLNDIWAVTPVGFGEWVYRYKSTMCDTGLFTTCRTRPGWLAFNNQVVGTRYEGITYGVIYFGWPLYYCTYQNASAIMLRALQDIENKP